MKINVATNLSINFKDYYCKFNKINKNINIYIIKDNELSNLNYFFDMIIANKSNFFLGIDFEFNKVNNSRQVALIQINYDDEFIIMFDPSKLTIKLNKKLKEIFFKSNCTKILHGAESLDIKYLFDSFFVNDIEKKKFINNFYDTKFICEFLNIRDNIENKKCKIYLLLLKYQLIDQTIYEKLIANEEKMGPIYNIIVDVNNMSKELINYTLFDVFYLNVLIKTLLSKLTTLESSLINFFLHQTLLYKEKIEKDITLMNSYNNFYFLDTTNNRFTITYMLDYYTDILKTKKFNFNIINNIPFFKKLLNIILKRIIVVYLSKNIIIYKNKNEIANNDIIYDIKNKLNLNVNSEITNELERYIFNDMFLVL